MARRHLQLLGEPVEHLAAGRGAARLQKAQVPSLLLDAAASAAMGLLLVAAAGPLSGMLGLPAGLLRWAGLVLVPFAAVLGWMGTRPRVAPGAAWAIIGCNVLWAADSGILLLGGWADGRIPPCRARHSCWCRGRRSARSRGWSTRVCAARSPPADGSRTAHMAPAACAGRSRRFRGGLGTISRLAAFQPASSPLLNARRRTMPNASFLADRLPDIPRWVEARDLLRGGRCQILGLREAPLSFVIADREGPGGIIVAGAPADEAIVEAARTTRGGSLVAPLEQAERIARLLPAWTATRAILHLLGDAPRLPEPAPGQVRFLVADELARLDLPADLTEELAYPAEGSPIAATIVHGRPVSFCYAGAITETLWDISIDTLAEHRRRGYAALCVTHLIHHMHGLGKQPVWGSDVENPASWMLARKLGFVPVDEIALFEPPEEGG